jgi:cation diffusion facilitator CzcD-associated flavoprotein CzcO
MRLPHYDVLVIGAGISGMYQLHRLRELGLSARVYEAGSGVGGTWYWNRYPGARFDSESYSYGYSFSRELLDEWSWSEHFSAQPETLRYLEHVADRFDLRRDIEFGRRVTRASWHETDRAWEIATADGPLARGRFLVTAVGPISAPTMPNIAGVGDFEGPAHHTGLWPHEPIDFHGRRVAVIGTGATGVQVIQEVAKTAQSLTVFQRRPNWCAPLHNAPIDEATQRRIKASYPEIFARCRETHGCFLHKADPRNALEVSPAEREAFYQQLYDSPGFGIWMGNFRDILIDERANATISEFVARKIRERVNDPVLAEKLIPKDHGFGTRRVPLETNYYEVYNQPNVTLVDLNETPIERITRRGVRTSDREHAFDLIIYATGFDPVTGALDRIDVRGAKECTLREKWARGPRTFLGLSVSGFPNLLTLVGPHNAATFCNIPRCIEQNVEWVTALLGYMQRRGLWRVEATAEAEATWTEHVHDTAAKMLFAKVDSWFMGINTNVPGRQQRTFLLYAGGAPQYRERCEAVANEGYRGFDFE